MKRRPRSRPRGFTLIEALAAITVLMIVVPVLMDGFTIAKMIAENARQTADATALAQSMLEEQVATQISTQNYGATSGDEDIGTAKFHWDAVLDDYDGEVGVQQMTVTVTWQQGRDSNKVALTTLIYIPGSTIQTTQTPTLGGGLP